MHSDSSAIHRLHIKKLGISDYQTMLEAMQAFTAKRDAATADELWLTEHPATYTLGLNRKDVRLPHNDIPLVLVDRGGKITYHGLGQAVIYILVDLKRRQLNVRQLVSIIESSLIELLAQHQITAIAKKDAPGVYVADKKIASLGLRLKNQCCYHGLSVNVDMDLSPFKAIDPCGYAGLEMTQSKDLGLALSSEQIGEVLLNSLKDKLESWPMNLA
jgi:lipoyl(octanoyl) transferase